MRTLDLGMLQIVALTDAIPPDAAAAYSFPNADLAAHPDAAARWLPSGRFRTRVGVFLIRTQAGDTLVDCGVGPGPHAYFPDLDGSLPAALAAAGSAPERVQDVLFTHLHIDHVGWTALFPRATFHVARAEWAHWSQRGDQAGLPHHVAAFRTHVAPLAGSGRLDVFDAGARVVADAVPLAAPGHTPGHHAWLVADRVLIAGDLWHNPAQIEVPAWCHRADHDKPLAIATRTDFSARAEREGWLIAAGHFVEAACYGTVAAGRFAPIGSG